MCGIVGAVSPSNIVPILIEGLKRLEYRGYDSCGVAVHPDGELRRARSTSRVAELDAQVASEKSAGGTGIAHTRWATHGAPAVHNAHPHFSPARRADATGASRWCTTASSKTTTSCAPNCRPSGYVFASQTDTEVIAHLVHHLYDGDLFDAVQRAAPRLQRRLRDRRLLPRRAAPCGRRAPGLAADPGRRRAARTSSPPTRWRWPA